MIDNIIRDKYDALTEFGIISITDSRGIIKEVNDTFCQISGFSREELIGSNHAIINSGLHDKVFFKDLWRTISKGQTWQGEIRNKKKDGGYYWVFTTIVPITDHTGIIVEYFSMRIDITESKELEQKLIHRNKALAEYAHITSHTLRQPICNILTVLEFVKHGGTTERALEMIVDYAQELDAITRLLTDVTSGSEQNLNFLKSLSAKPEIQRIMLVDDDEIQLLLNKQLLLDYNNTLKIDSYARPKQALEALRQNPEKKPDVILLDINMPQITGFQFLEKLSELSVKALVFILTSSINPKDVERAKNWECVLGFLEKPLNKTKMTTIFSKAS